MSNKNGGPRIQCLLKLVKMNKMLRRKLNKIYARQTQKTTEHH